MSDLSGKTILVTGARGGLGRPICRALAETDARVIGLDITRPIGLEDGNTQTHQADVLDIRDLEHSLDLLYWPVDGLVCLHGLDAPPQYSGSDPWRCWNDMLAVNLTGTMNVCRIFGESMAQSNGGSIVTIGSLYATHGPDQRIYFGGFTKPAAYSASKAGVLGLSRYLASLWASYSVRVNCLSPGGIGSDSTPADFRARFEDRVPMGRMGTPADLVGAITWLLGDESRYVTGQEICVNGGVGLWP